MVFSRYLDFVQDAPSSSWMFAAAYTRTGSRLQGREISCYDSLKERRSELFIA